MMYEIIDNFLDQSDFDLLKDNILNGGDFPWYMRIGVSDHTSNDGYFFTHVFYDNFQVVSNYFNIISPLLDKIDPLSLVRIKANFYPSTPKIIKHEPHVDFMDENENPIPCKACLFYVNSNNGKTIFESGEEIESIENRALFFDPSILHQSTTCTNDSVGRFNINFNYF